VRVLALDIGEKRIGVAVSDPSGSVATPVKVLATQSVLGDSRLLANLIDDYEVELVVVGLPLSLDGTEGKQAAEVRRISALLAKTTPLPFEYYDERLSSSAAKRAMTEAGVSDKAKRGSVDMVAASLFLQSFLDSRRAQGEGT